MILKRSLAWIIDWLLSSVPTFLYAFIFKSSLKTCGLTAVGALLFVFFVLLYPALFVFRDVIFKGQSIGKRLFRLRVIDNKTNALPSIQQLIVRNLFFLLYPVEFIMLLVSNKTLGDMATDTTVI